MEGRGRGVDGREREGCGWKGEGGVWMEGRGRDLKSEKGVGLGKCVLVPVYFSNIGIRGEREGGRMGIRGTKEARRDKGRMGRVQKLVSHVVALQIP